MLDNATKRRIDDARDILVGKVPDPKSQVEQITIALIYKFMDDMDMEAEELGGDRNFFKGEFERYAWRKIFDRSLGGFEMLNLYSEAILKMNQNPQIPQLFRDIFKNAYLPYRDPETLKSFLKVINDFSYDHSEKLGDAFEYLLSVLGSQGDAGQFRTPRHIIDLIVDLIEPNHYERILDPACGTAGFLIASYKHILRKNSTHLLKGDNNSKIESSAERTLENPKRYPGDKLTPEQKKSLHSNIYGQDISPDMVRLSLVNMYLHGFSSPNIAEYDTLTRDDKWNEYFDVILANPPFMTPKGGIIPHKRFSITSSKSELLFVDYIIEHLTLSGKAGIIVPEGILFVNHSVYKKVRSKLIENGLYCVLSLPHGVFKPYASVKTHVLLIDKALSKKIDVVLFVDINSDGFTQSDTREAIKDDDIPLAKDIVLNFKEAVINYASLENINLNSNSYIVDKQSIKLSKNYHLIGRWYKLESLFKRLNSSQIQSDTLGNICEIERGQSPNMATEPGPYTMVVPAEERKSSDHYTFDCNGICVPLVSSSGHGKADIKRLHYQEGKFALANTMAVLKVKNEEYINPKYLFEVLSEYKDIILTPLMSGATNVTMDPNDLENVVIPIPDKKTQKLIVERAEIFNSLEKLNQVDFSFLHEINDEYKEIEKRLNEMIIKLTNKMNSLISIKEIFDDYFEM